MVLAKDLWRALQKMIRLERKVNQSDLFYYLSEEGKRAWKRDKKKAQLLWGLLVQGHWQISDGLRRSDKEINAGIASSKKFIESVDMAQLKRERSAGTGTLLQAYEFHLMRLKAFEEEMARREREQKEKATKKKKRKQTRQTKQKQRRQEK
jgi:hypothetical protein